ncbi:tail fiber domain-containing protein [Patescibacteria group bacterium]|nr:tail fiber domain-containing protein [Patescibacteria group bacterium]
MGIGTTSPSARLTVAGDMRLIGRFADSSSSTGAVGSVLTATATGTAWVATSTLGLGGGGGSNWVDNGVFLNPLTATDGIVLTGSSTAMALRISALRDSSNSLGTVGQILQTNGATSQWVSTSTFGIALSDTTGTLAANRGGTGVSALGGANTVLYTSAVNTLASSSNFVFTGTNLGVGTSTPGNTLHIANGTTTQIRVSENTGQFFFDLGRNASDGMFQINGSQGSGYKWLNAGSEVMRISSGGNVGIGVSNPVAGLHLAKADMVVGTGEGGAPSLFTLRGVNASGTDVAGGDIRFDASRGTGIGGSGNLVFRTGNAVAAPVNVQNTTTIKNGNTNQLTTSHAVSAAVDNTLLVVQVAFASNGSTVSSITYNGTPLTLATSVGNGSNANRVEVWYLVNPTTGSNTLTANFSSFRATQMTAITLSNVNQASPIYAVATATNGGTAQSVNVSSTPSTLVLDVVSTETGGPTVDPAQTLLWNDVQSVFAAGSYRQGVTTNTIMNWTTAGNYNWVQAAIAINLVGSGGVTQTPLAEAMRLNSMGNLGLGTSSPTNRLSVVGNGFFTGNLTGANISAIGTLNVTGLSTLTSLLATNATATRLTVAGDFSLNGRFADSSSSTGAVGSVLTSTTNGTAWAATSSLGFSAAFTNSAQLAALLSDETGTGTVVFNTAPTFAGLTATGVSNFVTLNATTTNASTSNVVTLNASGLSTLTRVTATAATTTALTITGALRDSTNATGTVGQILQSTGTSTQWITSSAANSFVQGGNAFGTTAIFGTNDNQSLLFRTNGVTGMTLDSQGRLGIGTTGPLALLSVNATSTSSVTKQTTADFSVSGASVSAGIATTSNEIKLLFATTTNLGAGVMSTGPTLGSSSLGDGAHSIQRPDGTFLIVRGFNTVDTLIYNPVTNSTSAGPNLTTLAYQSAHSIQRPDGKFLIVLGNGAPTRTNIYDPVANTIIEGPALTNGISGMGAHSIQRPNGTYLIVAGGSTATNIYDPVANTVSGGPTLTSAATLGSHSIQRPDGTFLVLIGNGTVTNIYDPVANSIAAGPTLPNILGGGGHSIQRPDGRFLVVLGFLGTNTAIYDPINNTFSTGPSLTATVSPFAHSIQRPDGRFLVVLSGGTATNIYDPIANTMTAGPTLTASAGLGAHTLQRPDGRYLMVLGNSTASTLYDAGWVMSGSYESEDLNISQLNQSSLLNFNGNGGGKIEVAIKTATTQGGLTSAPYATTTSNRFPIRPVNGAQWAKVRVTLSRSVAPHAQPRQPFTPTNTWLGESDTKYRRDFAQPALYNFTIDNQSVFRKENADFATGFATSTALSFASSSVPLLASLIGGDNGLSLPYRIGLVSSSTQSDDRGVFSGGPTLANTSSLGAHSIQRPDGKFLIVVAANSNATNIYDPDTNTITAGPTIASGNPSNGSHSIQRPDGKFLIVVGNNGGLTNIYDPVANTIVAGPAIGRSANVGSHSIQRPDGKFLIVLGNNGTQTTIYDPVANTMSPGPNIAGSGVNLGAHSIQRPDGTFLIVSGLNTDTSIYDPVINTMYTGPALVGTAAGSIGTGGHSIKRPDGKFLVVFGAGGTNTSIYDPVTNTSVAGPALPAVAGNGSHSIQRPDGKFLLVLGGSSNTAIYDPVANTMSTGPGVGNTPGQGAHSIQRPDGRYMMVLGGGFTTAIYDAGWLTTGTYLSEHINNSQLNSQSAFARTGNADTFRPGVISISVRTAASEIGLGTSTWRTIKKSGDLINPASGDAWMQVRVVMRRPIAQQPNAGKNVYMGESTVVYNRLPLQAEGGTTSVNPANVFIRPTITSYKVFQVNSTDLAAFSLNGQNLFRFSAAGDAYTQTGGSWNSGGADIAEYFPTDDDTLEAGDIVTVAQSSAGLIAKSTDAYDDNALGIITTTPGIKLGIDITGGTAEKQPVALVGRVPTKVSLENGMIKKGDYITSSGRSGVGMKATDAGRVVGIALEDLDTTTLDDSGVGKVLVYVNPHTFLGVSFLEKITSKLSRWAYVVQEALGELGVTVTDDGNVGIGTTTPAARLSVTQSSNDYFGGFIISESGNTDFRSLSMATSGVLSFFGGDSSGTLNVATLNVAGEWTTPADVEHNEDVQTLTYGLDTLMQLQPRSYKMKNIEDMRVGFIAQELELIIPEVVDGVEGSKSISYGNLVAVVVKAVQELADRVTGFAEFFKTKKVETDELCIEDVCINKGQLQEILDKSDPTPEPSLSPEPLPLVPHTTSTSTSTPELPEEVSEEVIAEEEEVNVVEEVEEPVIEPIDDSVPAEPVPAEVVVTEPDTDAPLPE